MANYLLMQVEFETASGFTDESIINTFAFMGADVDDPTPLLDIKNAVANFYNGLTGMQVSAVGAYMSSHISRAAGGVKIKTYDLTGHLNGTPHGSPIDEDTFTLVASANGNSLPPQVASVLTLRARDAVDLPVEGSGGSRPRARRTGRLYIGPLNNTAHTGGELPRPAAQFRSDCTIAAEGLQDQLVDGDYAWGVWSRTAADMVPIVRAEMDDSFDILRSRKVDPTARTSRTFAPVPALVLAA